MAADGDREEQDEVERLSLEAELAAEQIGVAMLGGELADPASLATPLALAAAGVGDTGTAGRVSFKEGGEEEEEGREQLGEDKATAARAQSLRGMLLVGGLTFRVGYVQGLNHIANALLEHCGHDGARSSGPPAFARVAGEDAREAAPAARHKADALAFTLLRQVMGGRGLESLLAKDMRLLGGLLFQLDELIRQRLPRLATIFRREGITPSMFAGGWVLSVFSSHRVLPPRMAARLWDCFLAGGWTEVFKAVLAVLIVLQPTLLALARAAEAEDAVMETLLPVLQAPRAYFAADTNGSLGDVTGTIGSEEAFGAAVAAEAAVVRLSERQLRALASEFAVRSRAPRAAAEGRGGTVRAAVAQRVAAIRQRFRRASSLRTAKALGARVAAPGFTKAMSGV